MTQHFARAFLQVCLGSHYVKLNEWCDRQRSGSASRYRRAVASCISNILEHYRSCILSIEQVSRLESFGAVGFSS